jgi:hypothetical protein
MKGVLIFKKNEQMSCPELGTLRAHGTRDPSDPPSDANEPPDLRYDAHAALGGPRPAASSAVSGAGGVAAGVRGGRRRVAVDARSCARSGGGSANGQPQASAICRQRGFVRRLMRGDRDERQSSAGGAHPKTTKLSRHLGRWLPHSSSTAWFQRQLHPLGNVSARLPV